MPNFNKSKGFQLRSGNKSGLPFKQMGSSPAKINVGAIAGVLSTKKDNELDLKSSNLQEATTEGISRKATEGPGADNIKKMPKAGGETKTPDKLETVKAPDYKAPKEKKGNWINRMAEKRQKFQASEEGARFRDDMNRSANIVAGEDRYATDNLEKHKASKKADELHKVKMDNVERNQRETDLMNDMRQMKKDAYLKDLNKDLELPASETAAVDGKTGEVNMSKPATSSKDNAATRAVKKS